MAILAIWQPLLEAVNERGRAGKGGREVWWCPVGTWLGNPLT